MPFRMIWPLLHMLFIAQGRQSCWVHMDATKPHQQRHAQYLSAGPAHIVAPRLVGCPASSKSAAEAAAAPTGMSFQSRLHPSKSHGSCTVEASSKCFKQLGLAAGYSARCKLAASMRAAEVASLVAARGPLGPTMTQPQRPLMQSMHHAIEDRTVASPGLSSGTIVCIISATIQTRASSHKTGTLARLHRRPLSAGYTISAWLM